MSGLVGYGSSEDEDDVQERPAKVAKMESNSTAKPTMLQNSIDDTDTTKDSSPGPRNQQMGTAVTEFPAVAPVSGTEPAKMESSSRVPSGPAPQPAQPSSTSSSQPASPYTTNRTLLHNLTMPTIPNFDIPPSPPPPSSPTTTTTLAASTKKFTRFLDLKHKGVHFNSRLNSSSSLRNPSLLPKLMEYAGVTEEDSRMSTLSEEAGGMPVTWSEDVYVEALVRENDRWRKKRGKERDKVDFVRPQNGGQGK